MWPLNETGWTPGGSLMLWRNCAGSPVPFPHSEMEIKYLLLSPLTSCFSFLPQPHSQEPCSLFHWENSHNQKRNPTGSPQPRAHLPGLTLLCGHPFPCGWTFCFLIQRPPPCLCDVLITSPVPQARPSLQQFDSPAHLLFSSLYWIIPTSYTNILLLLLS